uniref:Transcription factor, MADS-box n=1 Tax=Tanacetum cinerariifolium TaxID=118510 RepID=A0A6L2NFH0_TANCI|nr:transcription factor, MADS-box [Tanacetum cinerariifolium]
MIISSDYQKSPDNFSQDPRILNDMINVYKRNRLNGKIRSYGLLEFCKDGKDNIEEELAKTKKGNLEGKYPTRSGFMDKYSVGELKGLSFWLGLKINQMSINEAKAKRLKEAAILNLKQKRYTEALAYVEEAKNLWSELDDVINLEVVIKLRSMEGDKHYEVFGVRTKASNVELTRAYRKTMFPVHPNKCLEFPEAVGATKRVRDAYRVLSGNVARRNYDRMFQSSSESPKNHHWRVSGGCVDGGGDVGGGGVVVAVDEWGRRVRESDMVHRIDPVTRSLFGFAGKIPPKKFSGGGSMVAGGGLGGRIIGEEMCVCVFVLK